jgi:Rrf2 family protein
MGQVKLSQGVEWGLHCAALIAQVPNGAALSRRVLAEHYGLPEAYLAKHLQALVHAGILTATPGPKGGFRLARAAKQITALDILEAIEGSAPPFLCQEIRQRGTGAALAEECIRPCAISTVMDQAHQAWRDSLRATTLADLVAAVPQRLRTRNQNMFSRPIIRN